MKNDKERSFDEFFRQCSVMSDDGRILSENILDLCDYIGSPFHEVGYLPANDNVRFTISESARIEVLKRLAKLNRERWEEEEAAGLHKKGKKC